jgi:hypothetical protein
MGFVYGTARGAGGGTAALIRGATPLQLIIASSCGFTRPSKAVPTVRLPLQQTVDHTCCGLYYKGGLNSDDE